MLKPGGVGQYICDDVIKEVATSTCAHCQRVTEIQSRKQMTDVVDFCRLCMRLICAACAGKPCVPHLKKIEMAEEAHYRRAQLAKVAGLG